MDQIIFTYKMTYAKLAFLLPFLDLKVICKNLKFDVATIKQNYVNNVMKFLQYFYQNNNVHNVIVNRKN